MAVILDIATEQDSARTLFGGKCTRITSGKKSTSRDFFWQTCIRIASSNTCFAVIGSIIGTNCFVITIYISWYTRHKNIFSFTEILAAITKEKKREANNHLEIIQKLREEIVTVPV